MSRQRTVDAACVLALIGLAIGGLWIDDATGQDRPIGTAQCGPIRTATRPQGQ